MKKFVKNEVKENDWETWKSGLFSDWKLGEGDFSCLLLKYSRISLLVAETARFTTESTSS